MTSGATVATHWHNGGHALNHEDVRAAKSWLRTLLESYK